MGYTLYRVQLTRPQQLYFEMIRARMLFLPLLYNALLSKISYFICGLSGNVVFTNRVTITILQTCKCEKMKPNFLGSGSTCMNCGVGV